MAVPKIPGAQHRGITPNLKLSTFLVQDHSYFFNCKKTVVYPSFLIFTRSPSPWHYGQKHLAPAIKKEIKRRTAIEPVIEHMKNDGHLGRNYLKGKIGDMTNARLLAVGYNFRLLLKWFRFLLCLFLFEYFSLKFSLSLFVIF